MSAEVGRAGFHVAHTKSLGERHAIVHEMMRELDPDAVAYWAARNPSIVVKDEPLNEAMVNDGEGGFRRCNDWSEVIDYGERRAARVKGGIKADRPDKNGEMRGGTVTTSMIVCHLPRSLCVEIPDFYPRTHADGSPMLDPATGEPLKRSRWVARDRDEARRYFEDVIGVVGGFLPGGRDAILAYDIQHSESTPHVQILADTFEPTGEGDELRPAWSRKWSRHRAVTDAKGRPLSGPEKMRGYHQTLKDTLIAKKWNVSPDFDEERHLVGYTKEDFQRVEDRRAEASAREAANEAMKDRIEDWKDRIEDWKDRIEDWKDRIEVKHAKRKGELAERETGLGEREAAVQAKEDSVAAREAGVAETLERLRKAREDLERLRKAREEEYEERERQLAERESAVAKRASAARVVAETARSHIQVDRFRAKSLKDRLKEIRLSEALATLDVAVGALGTPEAAPAASRGPEIGF